MEAPRMFLVCLLVFLLCTPSLCQLCSNGQTRLVGGANQTQGRVEVCISNTWGTICDDNWSSEDARVVCSQLGYPSEGAQSYSFAAFEKGSGPIWFSDVQCSGAEVSLQKCFKGPVGAAYCSHQEDAGVLCTKASAGSPLFPMEDRDYLPFISLGTISGVPTIPVPKVDDGYSSPIYVSQSFPFNSASGIQYANTAYVGTNGYVSLNMGVNDYQPQLFPYSTLNLVAPFWADTYIVDGPGQILYEVHTTNASLVPLTRVSGFISRQLGIPFSGSWMLVAHYDHVLPFGYTDSSATNTFQAILITNGSQSYAVFTYKCGEMRWSGQATIGFGFSGNIFKNFPLSGTINDTSVACLKMPATNWSNLIYPLSDATIQSPVFEFTTSNISLQDMPISILLNVSVLPYSIDQGLSALVLVDPNMAYFDRGFFNGYTWSFGPADFGRVLLYLPQYYLGSVRLNATAYNGLQTTNVYLSIYVQPVPTAPNLVVNSPICFNQSDQMIHITIIASLVDTNASETLYVYISNVSKYLTISNLTRNSKNEYVFNATQIPVTQLQVTGTFTTIGSLNMTVSAQAVLLTNGNKAYNNVSVVINACEYCNDGELRLVGGLSSLEGRVEVCYGNKWGGICSPNYYYWGTYEASAVCRQLGFYPYDAITFNNGYFGIGPTTYYLSVDYCDYRAEGLLDCYYHEPNYYYYYYSIATLGSYSCNYGLKDFAVRCLDPSPKYCGGQCTNGSIRLVDGSSAHEGRIEVCIGGCWGTVCANGFFNNEASVACKQLGFRYDGALQGYYGSGSGPIWLTGLICSGNESSLFDCGYRSDYEDAIFYCNHGNDVGIFCQVFSNCTDGDIRLVNGQSSRDGILEICYSSQWGSVCGSSEWTSNPSAANTVCKQLGYGENNAIAYTNYSAGQVHPIWADIRCDARAEHLLDCISNNQIGFQYYYYYYCNFAGVICQENKTRICEEGSVQLVGGSTPYDGKVLVCGRGTWGTVCGYNWDSLNAAVVCNQLGYPSLGAFPYSNAGQNYNIDGVPIWLYNLNCSGNEQELTNCSVVKSSNGYCNHYNDATVRCPDQSPTQHCTNGKVRLMGGSVPSEGRVEMCYDGQWGTMCGYESITTYSNVICRQLGYSPYGANVYHNSFFGEGSGGILLYTPNLLCIGNERSLPDCYHATIGFHLCNDHSNDVGVSCQATFNNTSECRSGSIRLVGGNYANQGTVEFCIGGTWNTICGYPGDWNETNSLVLCNQLGIKNSIPTTYFYSYFGQGSGFTLQLQAACTGNESSVFQCPPKSSTYYFQLYTDTCNNHYYDIGIQCSNDNVGDSLLCGDGDIRLVNQINAMDGVVEICNQNQWSTVCGDYAWTDDTSGAITACKQLGYSNTTGIPYDQYGYYGPTYISNVHCDARNSRLIDCDHNTALSYCYSVAAVRCQGNFTRQCEEGSLSLVRGSTPYEGTVQVCGNGIWGTVCSTYWNSLAASVVCHQLGYGDFGAIAYPYSYFGQSFGPIWLHNLHCSGNEQSLFNCSIFNITSDVNCYHNSDPGVICPGPSPIQNCTDGDVRLVGGSVPSQGRVELCYKGHWGTICGQYGDISTYTNVICRQLGYSPYNAVTYYYYGQGSGGIFLYTPTLLCIGNEKTLLDCYHPPIGYHECGSHSTDIGVTCQVNAINISQCTSGEIRLVGGSTNYEGRVEFCIGDTWFALCGYPWSWDSTDAAVLCDQFGLQSSDPVMLFDQYFGHGTGSLLQLNPLCTGNEGSLLACPSSEYYQGVNYAHYYSCYSNLYSDLGVRCGNITALPLNCSNGDLRLTDGDSEFNGRVEVCYGNQWGTVCGDNSWTSDTSGASTVCKQLGYSPINATPFELSLPRSGSHYSLLSAVHCDARVTRLIDCFHDPFNSSYCSNGAAGVSCEAISNTSECLDGAVRLVGGPTPYEGRVEVCARGTWGTICSNSYFGNGWSSLDASVVCRQLGFPSIGPIIYSSTWQYGIGQGPIWLYNIRCSGDEEELFDCPFNNPYSLYYDHYNDAGVMCQAPSPPQNCTNGDVRLVGGYAPSVGRVEMCYNEQWGTICGTYNDFTTYSNVICKQLGYSPYNANVYYYSYFGQGSGGIFLDTATLLCTGNETNLLDCYHSTVGYYQCGSHYADIGIACQASTSFIPQCESGDIHLVGGSDSYEGRVEYCIMGTWTSICAYPSSWNTSNSLVVCNELGFNTSRATSYFNGYFGYGTGSSLQVQALCTGNESSLFRCRSYDTNYDFLSFQTCYDHSYDLGVKCKEFCHDGDVRLLNGTTHSEGRVQFCDNGHWISIYGHPYAHWGTAEANVVCRQLGFAPFGATVYRDNRYGIGTGQDSLTYVFCNGYETDLQFCQYQINGYLYYAYYTAAISCKENCNECFDGSVHLVEGTTIRDGRLEVCSAGCWTGVCIPEQGWSAQDATVACKQLQLNSSVAIPRYYYSKTSTFGVTPQCNGSEISLFQCLQLPCHKGRYNSAGVECPVTVATNTGVNVSATTSFSLITGMRSSAISLLTSTGALTHSASFSVSLSQSSQTITSTLSATSNPMISNSIGISTLQKIANTFVTNIQLSSHTIQSSSSMIIIPTTSSVVGTTSSVQLNGPSQSFLLQTIASTFDATIQTSTTFPNTNEASLSLAPTTTRAYGTTSEMSPSPSLQIIIPTTSSVFGTTSSVQLNGPSQSFLLQTIASTFDATIQTSTTFPNTNEASLSLAPTTTRAYGTTSEIVKMSPSPSLQTIASSSKNTVQAAIASSDTDQSSLSLMLSPAVSDAYGRSSKVIEGSPSSPSSDLFSGNSLRPTIIQSMRAEISTSQLSTMTTEHHPSPTPLQPTNVPVVTFANSPLYSNGSIFISWVFESVASTQCTLITPSSVLHPPCIESYSATNLIEGIYTLIVTATSVTGYTALPVAHSWTVDLTSPVLLLTSYPSASSYYSIWNFTFNCVNEWKCSYSCSLELSNTVEKYVLCNGGYFIAENLQVGQEYMFSVFAVDGVGNIGNPAVYKWKFDTQLTSPDTLANQQLYTVYGTAAGILAAAIILVIIIAALCTLITIRRKSRSRVLLTVGYRQDHVSQQTAEHCIDKEKIFLEEMYKKESAEIPNTTFIENEHTTTL